MRWCRDATRGAVHVVELILHCVIDGSTGFAQPVRGRCASGVLSRASEKRPPAAFKHARAFPG